MDDHYFTNGLPCRLSERHSHFSVQPCWEMSRAVARQQYCSWLSKRLTVSSSKAGAACQAAQGGQNLSVLSSASMQQALPAVQPWLRTQHLCAPSCSSHAA